MRVIVPPIKSQGIKTKLVSWIMDVAPKVLGAWIEPFLGTGVVAFNSGYKKAILNDSNPHIINFYKGIQQKVITASLMKQYLEKEGKLLSMADNNGYEHYLKIRSRFNSGEFSPYDFIFLSRAGFNGMMRFGSKGNWNIPFCKKPDRFTQAYITKITNQITAVDGVIQPEPNWIFYNKSFADIIPLATVRDLVYCDPPYFGRHTDYYNGWTEKDEETLFHLLSETKAKFILSTWHHNDWRKNEMIDKFWKKFNIITRDHFYHNGASMENRRTIVEALVCNFDIDTIAQHNHGVKSQSQAEQLTIPWNYSVGHNIP
ncbi:MAG: Dam family site-specific DNA-(adenine-N6)-methyltransferase [Chlorobi bacterium]|nr:MAG: DNA adenine methylase [Chlorobi bacterium OLB7]MBK8912847.1 Dam family site-specific DNA-(adenine-N6)-methyltransferase [Chlorobiota bacterium]MBX7218012.1 Dam family site-specific DNA-(adenine-N6)-methyltransferase [Candidatus Kapabacteria bacterium]